jgi:uncharacterized protein (TIGR03437 family)
MTRSSLGAVFLVAAIRAAGQSPVPSTFFAMSTVEEDYPKVNFGALAHQAFAWPTIETTRGAFDFRSFDNYMTALGQHGLVDAATNTANMAMTLAAGTPSWAVAGHSTCSAATAGGPGVCTAPPDNIQDWTDFLTAVVQHYNGKTQPHIHYYELWNECNVAEWWTGTDAQMVALAEAAYPIVHQDPYSLLLTPSVAGPVGSVSPNSGVAWMTGYLTAGGSKYADGGAFHGYIAAQNGITPFPWPEQDTTSGCKAFVGCYGSIVTKATQLRAVFDQNGLAGKPMYQTEGSWGNQTITDLATEVAWIARYNLLQAGLRSTLNLQMAAWFTWGGGTAFGWGDIEDDSLAPTAAGIAYNQIYDWVVGANLDQPCSSAASGTWTCTLTRAGGYTAQAVWNTGGTTTYTPGAAYTQYRDLAGNTTPIPSGASVSIGAEPILLESNAPPITPVITLAANAEGEAALIAPNTWVEIKGLNLAPAGDARIWQSADFVNNQLPAQLDGVTVTVNGKNAFLYYISPTQVNILTPPDAIEGAVRIQLTDGQLTSAPVTVEALATSPSFFIFGAGPYAAAEHTGGSFVGPANLYAGLTTPARPGETVVLFANGFGATSTPVTGGSLTQGGTLSPLPAVTIGGIAATVKFAGLVAPGQFQFNVVVPLPLGNGDQPITATYNGLTTQPGTMITIQN